MNLEYRVVLAFLCVIGFIISIWLEDDNVFIRVLNNMFMIGIWEFGFRIAYERIIGKKENT